MKVRVGCNTVETYDVPSHVDRTLNRKVYSFEVQGKLWRFPWVGKQKGILVNRPMPLCSFFDNEK